MNDDEVVLAARHRDGDVVLRDGSTVRIRVMKPADEGGLRALLTSLSEESRWLRFYFKIVPASPPRLTEKQVWTSRLD